ncbi:MAG: carbohydrate binding domain-containing protein, partial [Clostridia bacterium]|nr:carbohydrate binding domain-containing protein [Clostridia bacterium]
MKIAKKLLSLLLIVTFCIPMLAFPADAEYAMEQTLVNEHAPAISEELLNNGSFEEFKSPGSPISWDACNAQNDPAYTWEQSKISYISDKFAKDGKYSLYLDNEPAVGSAVYHAYASTGMRNLVIGGTYEVSMWVYSPTGLGQFFFYVEGYLNSGANPLAFGSDTITPPKGEWTKYIWNFKINDEIDYIRFYAFMRGARDKGCALYFDDISMKLIKLPEYASLSTNEVLYYTDLDKGWASVNVRSYWEDEMKNWTADFALLDGEEVLQEEKGLKFSSRLLEWVFNPKLMTDRDKAYAVRVNIKDKNGDVIFTQDKRVERRYDRPKNMTRDGYLLDNNGEIYLPVDAYEVYDHIDSTLLEHTKRMGVTTIERYFGECKDPDIEAIIANLNDLYYNKGHMAVVDLYSGPNCAASPENIEGSKKMVEALKDHPGVFAFNIGDEIVAKNIPEELIEASYRLVRDIDTVHPVYCVDYSVGSIETMSRYTDIIGVDDYNYFSDANTDRNRAKWVQVNEYRKRSGKAGLQVTQNFRNSAVPPQNHYPSGTQIRNTFYQCLFEGVGAFGYYTFNLYGTRLPDANGNSVGFYQHEQGDAIASWMENERDDAVEYFLRGNYPHFASGMTNEINYRAYVKGKDIYYIILNRSHINPANIELEIKSDNNRVKVNSFKAEIVTGTENAPDVRKAR